MLSEILLSAKGYRKIQQMKPGANGIIFLVEHLQSKEKCVMKFSYVGEEKKEEFGNQMEIWKELCLKNENIVMLKEFFFDDLNGCIIMEFCENGDLESLIKKKKAENRKFSEYEIVKIVRDVFSGLRSMHAMKIIHRDVKPGNVLISKDGIYKLADFSISRILSGNLTSTFTGTTQYMAPEVFNSQGYDFLADVYSVGAIMYELMTLTPAFSGENIPCILANKYTPIDPTLPYSDELVQLVYRLLSQKPSERLTASQVCSNPSIRLSLVQYELKCQDDVIALLQKKNVVQEQEILRQKSMCAQLKKDLEGNARRLTEVLKANKALELRVVKMEHVNRESDAKCGILKEANKQFQKRIDTLARLAEGGSSGNVNAVERGSSSSTSTHFDGNLGSDRGCGGGGGRSCGGDTSFEEIVEKATKLKEEGNILYQAKKYDEALQKYNEAIKTNPLECTFYLNKAAALFELGCVTSGEITKKNAKQVWREKTERKKEKNATTNTNTHNIPNPLLPDSAKQQYFECCVDVCIEAMGVARRDGGTPLQMAKAYLRQSRALSKLLRYDAALHAVDKSLGEYPSEEAVKHRLEVEGLMKK